MADVTRYLSRLLRTELKRLNPRQYWDNDVISLNAAGQVLTEETTVATSVARVDEPLIDIFIRRNTRHANDDDDEDDEGGAMDEDDDAGDEANR